MKDWSKLLKIQEIKDKGEIITDLKNKMNRNQIIKEIPLKNWHRWNQNK
jgi:hypothetical protein